MQRYNENYQEYIENLFFEQIKRLTLSTQAYLNKDEIKNRRIPFQKNSKNIEELFNIELI